MACRTVKLGGNFLTQGIKKNHLYEPYEAKCEHTQEQDGLSSACCTSTAE